MSLNIFCKSNVLSVTASDVVMLAPYGIGITYFTSLFVLDKLSTIDETDVFTAEDLLADADPFEMGIEFMVRAEMEIAVLVNRGVLPLTEAGTSDSGEQLYRLK